MNNYSAANDLLDFYLALEYLSPQKIERRKDLEKKNLARFIESNTLNYPWQTPTENYNESNKELLFVHESLQLFIDNLFIILQRTGNTKPNYA